MQIELKIEIPQDTKEDIWIFTSLDTFHWWTTDLQLGSQWSGPMPGRILFRRANPGVYNVNMVVNFVQSVSPTSTGYAARLLDVPRLLPDKSEWYVAWAIVQRPTPTFWQL